MTTDIKLAPVTSEEVQLFQARLKILDEEAESMVGSDVVPIADILETVLDEFKQRYIYQGLTMALTVAEQYDHPLLIKDIKDTMDKIKLMAYA